MTPHRSRPPRLALALHYVIIALTMALLLYTGLLFLEKRGMLIRGRQPKQNSLTR